MKIHPMQLDRRSFLKVGAAGLGLSASGGSTFSRDNSVKRPISPEDFRRQLRGPILSIPTTYTVDFRVDYDGIRRMIERAARSGVRVFTLTSGNNQYDRLTYDEIKRLTEVLVETVAGRGITIAATGPWWTGPAVEYARFAESVGADAVQVLTPTAGDDENLFEHYKAVAAATRLGIVVHGPANLPLMNRLSTIDSIVAAKAEFTVDQTAELYKLVKGRWNIFQGGQKSHFLAGLPYGMQAYYSTFSTFAPEIAMKFWSAVGSNDLKQAGEIVLAYDVPFFQKWSHPFWRATLEHFGIASRYLRPPEKGFSDAQMVEVKSFYDTLGLKPR